MAAVGIGRRLAHARRRAGLSQRELAARAGVPQSTVGRIEIGLMDPRVETLDRLLRACGATIEVGPRLGDGVDRTQLVERLRMTPEERLRAFVAGAENMARLKAKARRPA